MSSSCTFSGKPRTWYKEDPPGRGYWLGIGLPLPRFDRRYFYEYVDTDTIGRERWRPMTWCTHCRLWQIGGRWPVQWPAGYRDHFLTIRRTPIAAGAGTPRAR